MRNLDDAISIAKIDQQNMLSQIDSLPDQLETAWKLSSAFELPAWKNIRNILICGMGGSAIGGELLAAYAAPTCKVPIVIQRDYGLPAWVNDSQTLVIASSHSGNTEETLHAFRHALESGAICMAVTTGGELEEIARTTRAPLWKFHHIGQPRAAVGYSFTFLLAILARLDLIPDPEQELISAVEAMRIQQQTLLASIPVVQNRSKRYAGQLMGRMAVVFGSGLLSPVARRWKTQINELAKAWAQYDCLPEADHNTLAGTAEPEALLSSMMALFLRSPADDERTRLRSDNTRRALMLQGINTDFLDARGDNPLSYLWTALHMGDYIAFYLAMGYGIDPSAVEAIVSFKKEMINRG
jgi:glucose/mannose-6-phosphate isomerase